MATYSNSPRLRAVNPATPTHSPHHSVHSSASSRLSVRNLTLHEYRKQQSSSASHATPPGKTLRRKPAAFVLKENDWVPSPSLTSLSTVRAPPRELHISQSTKSLHTYQQLPPSPPHQQHELHADEFLRSQSADPNTHCNRIGKVREFKPIKRLPKPLLSSNFSPVPITQSHFSSVTSVYPPLSPIRTASGASSKHSTSNGANSTPLPFSLSQFPQPPNSVGPPLSPLTDGNERSRVKTASFVSTAPVTPPATPAVVHYRGASFDLVNPHSSLVIDNIVTPSRELDSSDCLPLLSSDDLLVSPEMAPKRPLYGDLSSAYASIIRRVDEYPPQLYDGMPLPPTPVAQSPQSSAFDSPLQSPEWHTIDRKPSNASRFSLKQVARSLTQRFSRMPDKPFEQELGDLSESHVSLASASFEGEFPRPLERSYGAASPKASMFSYEPITPVPPLGQVNHFVSQQKSFLPTEQPRCPSQNSVTAPLSSMFPDTPSTPPDRAREERPHVSEPNFTNRPYYDDIASIYPSSSVYTDGSRHHSAYVQNRTSSRKSNSHYWRISEAADEPINTETSDALSQYTSCERTSRHVSKSLNQIISYRSEQQEVEKMDTISKFIDEYKNPHGPDDSQSRSVRDDVDVFGSPYSSPNHLGVRQLVDHAANTTGISAFREFQHNVEQTTTSANREALRLTSGTRGADKSALAPPAGPPPSIPAPLAPAFDYNGPLAFSQRHEQPSEVSSYGDTRDLLRFPPHSAADRYTSNQQVLQSPSSYSQLSSHLTPQVPRQALQQAEDTFATNANQVAPRNIPAIWSKRVSSHNLSRNVSDNDFCNQSQDHEREGSPQPPISEDDLDRAEWETVGNVSPRRDVRASVGESLANYSISEGSHTSRDSLGFTSSFPLYEDLALEVDPLQYHHSTPLRDHSDPFNSILPPPQIDTDMPTGHRSRSSSAVSSSSSSGRIIGGRRTDTCSMPCSPQQECFPSTPWADLYAFSDKETQDLLASGPNDEILYEYEKDAYQNDSSCLHRSSSAMQPLIIAIPIEAARRSHGSEDRTPRENSFEKYTVIGSKGNLTGTPHGTGMYDAGSSVADNSSPGAVLDSSPSTLPTQHRNKRRILESPKPCNTTAELQVSPHSGKIVTAVVNQGSYDFCASSECSGGFGPMGPHLSIPPGSQERSSRTISHSLESPFPDPDRRAKRLSLRSPKTPRDVRRGGSRAAVLGQTKLRQMVLAPNAQILSPPDRNMSDPDPFVNEQSARPSTSNTNTPLRTAASRPVVQTVFANQHSPHLLCPERALDLEDEAERRKLSWVIFAVFCVLPPVLILYRWMGDMVIVNVTGGRFAYVDPRPKNIALGAGIAVNASIVAIILLPILIAHFAGSL